MPHSSISLPELLIAAAVIGIGATALTDVFTLARRLFFRVPAPDYRLVGRWVGHMPRGRFVHKNIATADWISGELVLGWFVHYAVGIAFAGVLLAVWGGQWAVEPTLAPALILGVSSVAAPFLLMQPGMGAGVAASRTPRPWQARLRSMLLHAVFGFSLYVSALLFSFAIHSRHALDYRVDLMNSTICVTTVPQPS